MTRPIVCALAIATLAPALFAQPTDFAAATTVAERVERRVERLTRLLDLLSGQQIQATTIFTAEETALASVRTSLATARTALDTAIPRNDTAGIATAATQIGTLTTTEVRARATAEAQFYAILTAEQKTKYDTLKAHGSDGRGRGGRGGPGPR